MPTLRVKAEKPAEIALRFEQRPAGNPQVFNPGTKNRTIRQGTVPPENPLVCTTGEEKTWKRHHPKVKTLGLIALLR